MHSSTIKHDGPITGLIPYWIARLWMWFSGWDVVGQVPPGRKFVLIGAPHTSNWDFPFGLAAVYIYRLKVSWMGKDSLFRKPFGGIMRWLGGVAINRDSPHGVVDQVAKQFRDSRKLVVLITPSGTRKKRDYWKSGFYRIACAAQIPILCGYLDFSRKEICLGLSFVPTGEIKNDMERIREFYAGRRGKYHELETRIRLQEENT